MQTIYIDVLIVLNVYVNFFLLRTAARFTHSPLRTLRCIAASFYGSLFSLMILLPELPVILTILIKAAAAVTVVMAAFGIKSRRRLLINTAAFFTANFFFAGTVYAVYSWLRPDFVHVGNSYVYVDFSLLVLILTTGGLYLLICGVRLLLMRSPGDGEDYRIIIRRGERVVAIEGIADTGNALVDFFSGDPVIICGRDFFSALTGDEFSDTGLPEGFRLLPCSTVAGKDSGMIPIFRPDEVMLENASTGERRAVEAMIGFGESNGRAIFNPKLLKY